MFGSLFPGIKLNQQIQEIVDYVCFPPGRGTIRFPLKHPFFAAKFGWFLVHVTH